MIKIIKFIFVSCFSCTLLALECSQNGTNIYFINGVLTSKDEANKSLTNIYNLANSKIDSIDSSKLAPSKRLNVTPLYNPTFGLYNDGLELLADRLRVEGDKTPWKTLKYLALGGDFNPHSPITSLKTAFGIANIATYYAIEGNIKAAILNSFLTAEKLQDKNDSLANSIKNTLSRDLNDNKEMRL